MRCLDDALMLSAPTRFSFFAPGGDVVLRANCHLLLLLLFLADSLGLRVLGEPSRATKLWLLACALTSSLLGGALGPTSLATTLSSALLRRSFTRHHLPPLVHNPQPTHNF